MSALDPASKTLSTRWSLISQARGDSPDAYAAVEELARLYRDPIRDYIAACGHASDADDLVQEFFARKFLPHVVPRFGSPGTGSFRTFLRLCVKRFLIDCHRRRRRPGEGPGVVSLDRAPELDSAPPELESVGPAADRAMDQAWGRAVIARARKRLMAEFERARKEVLGAHFLRELDEDPGALSHREIAELTQLSPGRLPLRFTGSGNACAIW